MQYFNHIQCRIVRKELHKPKIKLFQRQQHKREANDSKGSGDPLRKLQVITVADLSGASGIRAPSRSKFFSFPCSFWQISCQVIDWWFPSAWCGNSWNPTASCSWTTEIERIWTPRGGRASLTPPLDPPMRLHHVHGPRTVADLGFLGGRLVKGRKGGMRRCF